ncbi:MAG TPA: hypothetical protein VGO57_14245 [Verrucomicrobiae bacterium]
MIKTLLQRTAAAGAIILLGCISVTAQDADQELYGITFFNNQLIAIDPATGQGTLVGSLNATLSGYGIAARYGRLYTFNPNSDQIVEINPATAAVGRTINIGVTNLLGEGDLAFRADGTGFLVSALHADTSVANDFYTFDVIAGTSHKLGSTTVSVDALAFDGGNVLYALGQDDVNLYIVDQTNGTMTAVGPLGVAMSSPFAGMTFGPDGNLYAAINDQLYLVDKTTGAASVVSTNVLDFGFSSVSGLAFQAPQSATRLEGVTFFGNQLFSIDPRSGEGTLIGSLGGNISAYGIAVQTNTLYTFDPNNDQVLSVNPNTGFAGAAVNIGVSNLRGEGDLAFRSDGTGFLASALTTNGTPANDLYAFDVATGTSTRVGTTVESIDALAFDTNDVLYALGQDDQSLYTVNQTSGAMTLVGPLGVALSSPFAGMTFGPDGTLYAAINDQLFTIDKVLGTAMAVSTNVLDFGFSSVSGLAFAPSPAQLTITKEAAGLTLYWFGSGYTLLSSTNVAGPYTTAGIQDNPGRIPAGNQQMFFRLQR